MSNAPFPIDPRFSAIAVAYKNQRMIADDVMPRVRVGKQEFKYHVHNLEDGFTIPDTKVGRKSQPNQVEFSSTERTDSTNDYGLDAPVPQADIDNAPEGVDKLAKTTESTMDLILLDREVRVANLIQDPNSYAATNRVTMTGTDRINNASFDVIGFITDILDSMLMRATDMTLSRQVLTAMLRHPDIVKGFHGNDGDRGMATIQYLQDLFELERIHVGQAFVNTARKGQSPNLQRAWSNAISLSYVDPMASTDERVSFALTAQWGDRIAGSIEDKDIGMRGGQRVRVGESVKELITAPDLGYLIQDPLN